MYRSRNELKIEEILKSNGFNFETEYTFPDLVTSGGRSLRFDFAVFDDEGNIDFLIEFQGIQHYEAQARFGGKRGLLKQKYNDNQKRIYCAKNDYRLVAIPYWEANLVDISYILERAGY